MDLPNNVVVAGNPARIIRKLDEYYEKRKKVQLNESMTMVRQYVDVYGRKPPIEALREHFWLFEDDYEHLVPEFKSVMALVYGTEEKSKECFANHKKQFNGYDEFLAHCLSDWKNKGD